MAARYNSKHLDLCREKIQTSQLINRLQNNAMAEKEFLSAGQLRSIEILLRKTIPDLSAVDHSGEVETSYMMRAPMPAESAQEWEQSNSRAKLN